MQQLMHRRAPICIKIVRERHWCACKFGTILLFNNNAYRCPLIEYITGPLAVHSSKKYGPRIKAAINPHHTVTFGDCNGTCKIERGFSGCQIRKL